MRPTQRKPQTREQGFRLLSLLRSDVTDTEDCCGRLLDLIENQTICLKLFCQETLFASMFTIEQGPLWARETHSDPPSVALSRFHMLLVAQAVAVWEEFCKLHEKP